MSLESPGAWTPPPTPLHGKAQAPSFPVSNHGATFVWKKPFVGSSHFSFPFGAFPALISQRRSPLGAHLEAGAGPGPGPRRILGCNEWKIVPFLSAQVCAGESAFRARAGPEPSSPFALPWGRNSTPCFPEGGSALLGQRPPRGSFHPARLTLQG